MSKRLGRIQLGMRIDQARSGFDRSESGLRKILQV